jgi:hypothetical protein
MSTILKALRRLEQEKSAQSDRSLSEAVVNVPPPPRADSSRWLVAGGSLAGAFALAVTLFLVFRPGGEAEQPDPVEVAEAAPGRSPAALRRDTAAAPPLPRSSRREVPRRAAAPATRPAPRTEPEAPPGLPPAALTSEVEMARLARPTTGAAEAPDRSEPAKPEPAAAEERIRLSAAALAEKMEKVRLAGREAALEAVTEPAPKVAQEATPEVASEPSREAARETAPAAEERIVLTAAPSVSRPSPTRSAEPTPPPAERPAAKSAQIARSPLPAVYVERTIWHPDADRRVAVIELEGSEQALELHEGDAVGTLVVGEIAPSGVSFYRDGALLRRRVGER